MTTADRRANPSGVGHDAVRIVGWSPERQPDFYRLNAEWLSKYYTIERFDHEVLSNPQAHIIDPGGAILFAVTGDEVVGTCALMLDGPGVYELTKMGVTETMQGRGIGRALIVDAIAEFRRLGGRTLFLESQRKLAAALALYETMGFELQPGVKPGSHYARADVYMIWRDPAEAKKV
jgi:ribosomal protein S18 acetylase RimI-like enzyme